MKASKARTAPVVRTKQEAGNASPSKARWLLTTILASYIAVELPAWGASNWSVLGLECENFQFSGDWANSGPYRDSSGPGFLIAGEGAPLPAVAPVLIPRAGNYRLWVRTVDFPGDRPGARNFMISIAGKSNSMPLGRTGKAGWSWEKGDLFALSRGPALITLSDNKTTHFGRVDAIILSDDPEFVPKGKLDQNNVLLLEQPPQQPAAAAATVPISPLTDLPGGMAVARLENEFLRVSFVAARRGGQSSVRPTLEMNEAKGWSSVPLGASAETYQVLRAEEEVRMQVSGQYLTRWVGKRKEATEVEFGGVKVRTVARREDARVIWSAGQNYEAILRAANQVAPNRVQLDFYPTEAGQMQGMWELAPGSRTVRVELTFTPAEAGQYSLGYHLFNRKPLGQVQELLLPFMVQRKRFPHTPYTLIQAMCPTPVSLMQTAGPGGPLTWGVAADPSVIPYEFPEPEKSRFGLHIRSSSGDVQPSIYGPLVGTAAARVNAGTPLKFAFRILVQPGDWYAGYRTVADGVYGWRDYRKNNGVSLTGAALNMIDLYLDDQYGGWWERAKAPYQIESKNGSTQSSPLTAVALYRLTGDRDLYRRRTLPSLEFLLSRDGSHFSPVPEDTGRYPKGSMKGPANLYGTTVYGGIWEMMNRRTAALAEIALPSGDVRFSSGYSHSQPFEEWLARYLLTRERAALDRAIREADAYIQKNILNAPTEEIGTQPFFLITFTPTWEGLLRLYEVTKEERFLEAAAFGARQVMTGMWTQPTPVMENITVHPGGVCHGDLVDRKLHKGPEPFRLGWPRKAGDTPEHQTPGWLVSNVGLGFEQPVTYPITGNGGRMIFQAPWTPGFLRLAQFTGDSQFATYARNAVVGRWANYPGYYITTFTDLMQNPRYPYEGPDMGFIYYHHILVHLSWTLDYLVSDAAFRSRGAIRFPSLRQFGYAYFDNLVYGHAPGEVMGETGVWLWLRKGLVGLDNPQINYLTAHSGDKFFVILMNENNKPETVNVVFEPGQISPGKSAFERAKLLSGGEAVRLSDNTARVTLEARGLKVLMVDGLRIQVPSHRTFPAPRPSKIPGLLRAETGSGFELRAAAIQMEPGAWDAYVWVTAGSRELKEISLVWRAGDKSGTVRDTDYPYEFSVPVSAGNTEFRFSVKGLTSDGKPFSTEEKAMGVSADQP